MIINEYNRSFFYIFFLFNARVQDIPMARPEYNRSCVNILLLLLLLQTHLKNLHFIQLLQYCNIAQSVSNRTLGRDIDRLYTKLIFNVSKHYRKHSDRHLMHGLLQPELPFQVSLGIL